MYIVVIAQLLTTIADLFWANSQGLMTESNIFNFSKAFDKVDLKLIFHKLDHIGVDSIQLAWMWSFLSLELCKVTLRILQGSVLGPLLFIV